jgi:urease accessory protein
VHNFACVTRADLDGVIHRAYGRIVVVIMGPHNVVMPSGRDDSMLRLHGVVGHERDAALQDKLHELEHAGAVEQVFIDEGDLGRRRFRLTSDRGTDCAISLDRDEALTDGAVLLDEPGRMVLVRIGAPRLWRLRPATTAAALRLGWSAGALHWRVRFDGDELVVVLDSHVDDYRARIADLLAAGGVTEITEAGGPAATRIVA